MTTPEAPLRGIFAVKLPVSDLAKSREWYGRVFGFEVEFEFPDEDGVVRGVAGHLPGVSSYVGLREDRAVAGAVSGFNLLNVAVDDRAAVERWAVHLDEQDGEALPGHRCNRRLDDRFARSRRHRTAHLRPAAPRDRPKRPARLRTRVE